MHLSYYVNFVVYLKIYVNLLFSVASTFYVLRNFRKKEAGLVTATVPGSMRETCQLGHTRFCPSWPPVVPNRESGGAFSVRRAHKLNMRRTLKGGGTVAYRKYLAAFGAGLIILHLTLSAHGWDSVGQLLRTVLTDQRLIAASVSVELGAPVSDVSATAAPTPTATSIPLPLPVTPVSYTHLRAHETSV